MKVRISALAHAKVNLALHVGRRRPDGYHPVATVIQRLALHDRLEITLEPSASGWQVQVASNCASVPRDRDNLAGRAVELLREELSQAGFGDARVSVRIEKRIPAAAGLGGGSADAAAVLWAIDRRLGLGIGREELARRAATLGSDVPACLYDGAVLGTGRGEKVKPVAAPVLWWVLANPGGGLSTREVYQAFDASTGAYKSEAELEAALEPLLRALSKPTVAQISECLYNDLQEAACRLHGGIEPLMRRMAAEGALGVIVCGSGPTVAGLAADWAAARKIACSLARTGAWTWWGPGQPSCP